MFELLFFAAASSGAMARGPVETDCRPQVILTADTAAERQRLRDRNRQKPQQPIRNQRPCLILTNA